jgi:hypothetical protein
VTMSPTGRKPGALVAATGSSFPRADLAVNPINVTTRAAASTLRERMIA